MLNDAMDGGSIERRRFLRHCGVAAVAAPLWWTTGGRAHAQDVALPALAQLGIRPRREWAGDRAPVGPLDREAPGDVRFLLVHHTASGNTYDPDDVPSLIRGFYDAHTGPDKGWPDVAYNFFVDRFGTVWEGREGSLSGPVQPSATGGSQGFAQLGCFIGDHRTDAPTADARRAMTRLLAGLADAYAVDTSPGATVEFLSRGSNRWPEGASVTAATISAHRDMSRTECPGDVAYALVRDEFPAEVSALRLPPAPVVPAEDTPVVPSTSASPSATAPPVAAPALPDRPPDTASPVPIVVGGGVALLAAGAIAAGLHRRALAVGGSSSPGPFGPGPVVHAWRVLDGPTPTGPGAAIHEVGEHVLLGALAYAATPTPVLADVLEECRRAARRIDRRPSRGSSATTLIGQALTVALRTGDLRIELAVLLVEGSTCTVIATEPSMGAIRTAGSVSRLRPSRIGAASPRGPQVLFASTCPQDEVIAVVLCAPAPPAEHPGSAAEISQFLSPPADPATGIAGYRHAFFGVTGFDPTMLGFRNG